MILEFRVEVKGEQQDIPFIADQIKRGLRPIDNNAKVHFENSRDHKFFEQVELDAYDRGELPL